MSKKKIGSNTAKRRPKAAKHRRGPGKPFVKDDPRINRNGQIGKGALAFNRSLRELLVAEGETDQTDDKGKIRLKKVEWLVRVVWNKALKGEAWAVDFIAERTEGKVTQPVSGDLNIQGRLSMAALKKSAKACKDGTNS
jgi:hypothetical protein